MCRTLVSTIRFLSTLSLRRATGPRWIECRHPLFLSTLSLRRATVRLAGAASAPDKFLSTLSLRRATGVPVVFLGNNPISIHALLAESDAYGRINDISRLIFLSTLSLRRATGIPGPAGQHGFDFYPRSPCGERPHQCRQLSFFPHFYPRSPCGERLERFRARLVAGRFLSTLSLRRATQQHNGLFGIILFLSTLSLRRATVSYVIVGVNS